MEKKNSRKEAMRLARRIGCQGAHQGENGEWMPCATHEELIKISNNAERHLPRGLKSEEPPCIGCKGVAEREKQGKRHKKRWEKFRERGVQGIESLEGGGLVSAPIPGPMAKELHPGVSRKRVVLSKALNDRQQALYEDLEAIVEKYGKFDWSTGPNGSHYTPAAKNPFIKDKLVCSNCAFWLGPNGCEIVEGELEPNAICKFWVIEGQRLSEKDVQAVLDVKRGLVAADFDVKALGRSIGRRGKPRVEAFDPNAIDADSDGLVQEGTTAERPATNRLRAAVEGVRERVQRAYVYMSGLNRSRLRPNDVKMTLRNYSSLKEKIHKKYGITDITSVKQAKELITKEFPNMKLDNFGEVVDGREGSLSPQVKGQVYSLLMFADSLSSDDKLRETIGYFDNDATGLKNYFKSVNQPDNVNVLGQCLDAVDAKSSRLEISMRPTDMKRLSNESLDGTYGGMFIIQAMQDIKQSRDAGRLTEKEYAEKVDELEEITAGIFTMHELGHAVHAYRGKMEPYGFGPDYGRAKFNLDVLGDDYQIHYEEALKRVKQIKATAAMKNKSLLKDYEKFYLEKTDEEGATAYLFAFAREMAAIESDIGDPGFYSWADSLTKPEANKLRQILFKTSMYGTMVDSDDVYVAAYEGVAEWFAEMMYSGKSFSSTSLNPEQRRVLKKFTSWFRMKENG